MPAHLAFSKTRRAATPARDTPAASEPQNPLRYKYRILCWSNYKTQRTRRLRGKDNNLARSGRFAVSWTGLQSLRGGLPSAERLLQTERQGQGYVLTVRGGGDL